MQVYIATHGETLDGYMRTQPNFMAVPLVKTFWKRFAAVTRKSYYSNHHLSRDS